MRVTVGRLSDTVFIGAPCSPAVLLADAYKSVSGTYVMSRYTLDNLPDFRVIVGWNEHQQTYFFRVEDKFRNHEIVLQEGIIDTVDTLEQLIEALEPFVTLPESVQRQLESDRRIAS